MTEILLRLRRIREIWCPNLGKEIGYRDHLDLHLFIPTDAKRTSPLSLELL